MGDKTLIRESELDENLVARIYHSEEKIILEICYMNGRFMIIKNYNNDRAGEKACEDFIDKFKSVDDIFQYFKIKRRDK